MKMADKEQGTNTPYRLEILLFELNARVCLP